MNPNRQPTTMQVTIEPNEKYRRVITFYHEPAETDSEWDEWSEEERDASDSYIETIDTAPGTPLEDGRDISLLSWSDFSVAKDPDLVSKIATYFDGMEPDEPTDLLRAKLRLLDCEIYTNAQIAAQSELSD